MTEQVSSPACSLGRKLHQYMQSRLFQRVLKPSYNTRSEYFSHAVYRKKKNHALLTQAVYIPASPHKGKKTQVLQARARERWRPKFTICGFWSDRVLWFFNQYKKNKSVFFPNRMQHIFVHHPSPEWRNSLAM